MEIFFSTVNDSFIRQKFSQVNCTFIGKTFQNPTASSDTDTTLSLALKQFDAQNDKIIYLRYHTGCFQDRKRKDFKKMAVQLNVLNVLSSEKCIFLIQC
jgi:hypothetical protein